MMNVMENLKIGDCLMQNETDFSKEGVVTNIYKKQNILYCDILWIIKSISEKKMNFKYQFFNKVEDFNYERTIIPHFCKIENLYSILEKYSKAKSLSQLIPENHFKLLGSCCITYDSLFDIDYSIIYLKSNKYYLELIIPSLGDRNNSDYYIYIQDDLNLENLNIYSNNLDITYYLPTKKYNTLVSFREICSSSSIKLNKTELYDLDLEKDLEYKGIELRNNFDILMLCILKIENKYDYSGVKLNDFFDYFFKVRTGKLFLQQMKEAELR